MWSREIHSTVFVRCSSLKQDLEGAKTGKRDFWRNSAPVRKVQARPSKPGHQENQVVEHWN